MDIDKSIPSKVSAIVYIVFHDIRYLLLGLKYRLIYFMCYLTSAYISLQYNMKVRPLTLYSLLSCKRAYVRENRTELRNLVCNLSGMIVFHCYNLHFYVLLEK